jgi:hypothetical protein
MDSLVPNGRYIVNNKQIKGIHYVQLITFNFIFNFIVEII